MSSSIDQKLNVLNINLQKFQSKINGVLAKNTNAQKLDTLDVPQLSFVNPNRPKLSKFT